MSGVGGNWGIDDVYDRLYSTEGRLRAERFALDRLIDASPPEVLDRLLADWLSYGGLCFKQGVNAITSEVGLSTYRTLLAARLRVEAYRESQP